MQPIIIDTHTHLYDEQFDEDRVQIVNKAIAAGVEKMLLPNCNSTTIDAMMSLHQAFPKHCLPMMGLHPVYVKEDYKQELEIVNQQLAQGNFVAVGEIGLDFYWDTSFKSAQIEAFEQQIVWALAYQLPIVIHTRDSIKEGIAIVRKYQQGNLKGVFHCFSGDAAEAKAIIDLGFHLGIGGVLTFKNSGLKDFIHQLPLSSLLLETDAPYLAPVPYRGKRNESSYLPLVAQFIAEKMNCTVQEIATQTTQNAKALFQL